MSKQSANQQETVRYYSNFEGYYLPPYLSNECTYSPFINILNDDGYLQLDKAETVAINGLDGYALPTLLNRFKYAKPKK